VIFGAGLGGPIDDEYGSFGEPTDPIVLAERLDEGLGLLQRFWSGEPVTHDGRHFQVRDVTLLPASVQRPHPPVWIGGFWPHRPPMRRAARRDGAVPLFTDARHGHAPPVNQVRDLVAYVHRAHPPSSRWVGNLTLEEALRLLLLHGGTRRSSAPTCRAAERVSRSAQPRPPQQGPLSDIARPELRTARIETIIGPAL
jgi:alkanesulfonate monooxygenase SsuD/methylene tetrahydromethanopterin reductase-like flavin-dependent oxidoreductase (luciferase family)